MGRYYGKEWGKSYHTRDHSMYIRSHWDRFDSYMDRRFFNNPTLGGKVWMTTNGEYIFSRLDMYSKCHDFSIPSRVYFGRVIKYAIEL